MARGATCARRAAPGPAPRGADAACRRAGPPDRRAALGFLTSGGSGA